MKLLFVLYRFFPFGGLQRDMLSIATGCYQRGHKVSVYTTSWEGEIPSWLRVISAPVSGYSNHVRMTRFGKNAMTFASNGDFDQVVGFNKLPGLDHYYAADSCYQDRVRYTRCRVYRWLPRYRTYVSLEEAVFGVHSQTRIMMLSSTEIPIFQHYYQTEAERMTLLPPGIHRDRYRPEEFFSRRRVFRETWNIDDGQRLVLMVGSGFRTKGLDRAIRALASLPKSILSMTKFMVVGADKKFIFLKLAKHLSVANMVFFMGGRYDVEQFLWGADLLIHPAYRENSGMVLLEAMIAGLPVLTTASCGFSHYVEKWQMGRVIGNPFEQRHLNCALAEMLESNDREKWISRSERFASEVDVLLTTDRAIAEIENLGVVR